MRNHLTDTKTSHWSPLLPVIAAYCALALSGCLASRSTDQQNIATQRNEYRDTCNGQPIHTYETIDPSITARYHNAWPIEVIVYARTDGNRSILVRHSSEAQDTLQRYDIKFMPDDIDSLAVSPTDRVVNFTAREYPFLRGRTIERVCINPHIDGSPHSVEITLWDKPSIK